MVDINRNNDTLLFSVDKPDGCGIDEMVGECQKEMQRFQVGMECAVVLIRRKMACAAFLVITKVLILISVVTHARVLRSGGSISCATMGRSFLF